MPTNKGLRRQREEARAFQLLPPEGLREPFKLIPIQWTERLPMGMGGQNNSKAPDALASDEATLIRNLDVREWGLSDTKPFLLHANSDPVSADEISLVIGYASMLGSINDAPVVLGDDELYHWDGTWNTVTTALTTNWNLIPPIAANVLDNLIITSLSHVPILWDGTSATMTDLVTAGDWPAGEEAEFVTGFADRAVFAVISDATDTNYGRLRWSVRNDPLDYTGIGSGEATLFDPTPGQPGDKITGLTTFDKYLVIFRENSIWIGYETGDVNAPIAFHKIVTGYGLPRVRTKKFTVTNLGSVGVAYVGYDNVYLWHPTQNGGIPQGIGTPIRDAHTYSDDVTSFDSRKGAFSQNRRGKEYWLISDDGKKIRIWSIDPFLSEGKLVWRERVPEISTNNMSSIGRAIPFNGQPWDDIVIGLNNGDVLFCDEHYVTATQDDGYGTVPTSTFESPQVSLGPNLVQLKRVNIAYSSDNDFILTTEVSEDGGTTWVSCGTTQIDSSDAVIERSIWVPNGILCEAAMIRFTFTNTRGVKLYGYRIGFQPRGPILGYQHAG